MGIAIDRDVVIGDKRVATRRRGDIAWPRTGNVESNGVAIVQHLNGLSQVRFAGNHGGIGSSYGDDRGVKGVGICGNRRYGEKTGRLFHDFSGMRFFSYRSSTS